MTLRRFWESVHLAEQEGSLVTSTYIDVQMDTSLPSIRDR